MTICLILLATFLSGSLASAQMVTHDLTIMRHTSQALTDAQADGKLSGASVLLQAKNGQCKDEVACCVEMVRDGAVGTFGPPEVAVITNQAELDAVFAVTGNIKVVTSAQNCCNEAGGILGCGKPDENNFVILASAPADVWAHEFGHNKGLPHRDDCAENIMHTVNLNTNSVNTTECAAFRAGKAQSGPCPSSPYVAVPGLTTWGILGLLVLLAGAGVLVARSRSQPE